MNTHQPAAGPPRERGPAAGLLAVRDRLAASLRGHPLITDAMLAALVLAASLPPVTSLPSSDPRLAVLLTAAIAFPLAWRRRAPFAVLVIITVPAVVQLLAGLPVTDLLAFLIAFYTVAACSRPLVVGGAAAMLEAGVVAVLTRLRVASSHAVLVWALSTGLLAAAGLLGYYVRTTRQARLAAQAEREERLERDRAHQAQLAAAAERARIAREMHDIVAHNIAVMIALAEGASYTRGADPDQAAALMRQVSATGRTALTEMRRLLGVLRQPTTADSAPQPNLADLDSLLMTFRAAGLPAELSVTGHPGSVPPSAQLAVYRIITEALTNTLKHATGASARVHLSYFPDEIRLEVTDDGRSGGEVAGQGLAGAGHGIAGIRERAAVFGGQASAGPVPGGGWRVQATLRAGTEGT